MIADSNIDYTCCELSVRRCQPHCKWAQPTWCPVCQKKNSRRRCQSESIVTEGDPLKEINRCCDIGCDCNIYYNSRNSHNKKTDMEAADRRVIYCPADVDMEGNEIYGIKKPPHPKLHKEKFIAITQGNKFRNFHHEMEYVNSDLPEMSENPRHLLALGDIHKQPNGLQDKYLSNPQAISATRHEKTKSAHARFHSLSDGPDNLGFKSSLSYSERDKCSAELRAKYVREMEVLRSKLNLLKDGMTTDAKRLRHRSESEPGFGGNIGGEPKRARDNSHRTPLPGHHRKLPGNPTATQSYNVLCSKRHLLPFQRETKSLPPCVRPACTSPLVKVISTPPESKIYQKLPTRVSEEVEELLDASSDSDIEGSTCGEDLLSQEDGNASEDDNHSVLSSLTSSSGSNTPSRVGETLESITLNEFPKKITSQVGKMTVPNTITRSKTKSTIAQVYPFRNSLFSHVPPYVKFTMHDTRGPPLPVEISRLLKWKLSTITPVVIRRTLVNSGFKLVRIMDDIRKDYLLHYISLHAYDVFHDFLLHRCKIQRGGRDYCRPCCIIHHRIQ